MSVLVAGMQMAQVYNLHREKNAPPKAATAFMPYWREHPEVEKARVRAALRKQLAQHEAQWQ